MEEQEALDSALAKVNELEFKDDSESGAAPTESQQDQQQAAAETPSGESEAEEQQEPAPPAIEPPSTWKAELKARWNTLPEDLQRDLAQWETERNQGFNSKLNESAEAKKAAEAERQAAQQERLRYAQQIDAVIQQTLALDPVLSVVNKMTAQDWAKLDPAQAIALQAQAAERQNTLRQWQAESARLKMTQADELGRREEAKLAEKIPEWRDSAQREKIKAGLSSLLQERYDFRPEELSNVLDSRHVRVALDAMRWQEHLAAQKAAAEKKVATAPKVVKPSATQDNASRLSDRAKALRNRALRSGKENDAVEAVLAAIG